MMGIRDALATIGFRDTSAAYERAVSVVPNTRAIGDTLAPSWAGKASWPAENILVLTRDGYRKCVTAFAAINLIADAVAEATLRVYEDQGENNREELIDHPMRLLMQRPNPGKSESELLGLTIRHAAIAGFSVLEKVRSARGNVVQLWHLNPAQLKPVYRDQAPPDWDYTVVGHPSSPFRLKAEDVVVFTYMDDVSLGVTGDTPLRAVMRQAGILHALTDFVKLLLDRGGVPPIVLIAEPIKDDFGESVMLPFSVVPTPVTGLPEPEPEPVRTDEWFSDRRLTRAHAFIRTMGGPAGFVAATDEDADRHAVRLGAMLRGFSTDTDPIFRASTERMFRGAVGASNQAAIVRIGTRYASPLRTFWRKQGERILQSIIDLTGARSAWDGWLAELVELDARHSVAVHRHSAENVSVRAAEFVDWEEEDRLLAEVMTRLHNGTGKAAWQAIAKQLDADGLSWDLANPNVRAILRDLAQRIVGINDTTRDDVRRVLADALDEGVTLDELSKRFRGLFEETYKSRAMTVARTETQVAYNTASVAGYRETGVVDSAQLMDNSMHDTDPGSDGLTCAQRDGLVVPLDEVGRHIEAEHPNGTLAVAPVLAIPLGQE